MIFVIDVIIMIFFTTKYTKVSQSTQRQRHCEAQSAEAIQKGNTELHREDTEIHRVFYHKVHKEKISKINH